MKRFLSYFRETGTPITFRRGTNLFFQGEVPRDALLIIDGIVKASIINQTGEETIVNLYSKGALVPIVWANRQSPCAVFHYQAVNDVRAIRMNRDDLWSIIDSNAEVQRGYLEFMLSSQASTVLRLTGLCQSRAIDKIAYTLYFLTFRYGITRRDGQIEIDMKLTQGMLASLIGQTRESTAKNLKTLKEAGVVDYTGSRYFVHKDKLENFLGDESFSRIEIDKL